MSRAKLYYIPGLVWHITQRCHNRDFLLKFSRDRKRWLYWLFQAKKRYGLCILNYIVTSNHIHLLVYANDKRDVIPRSIQLTASRPAREYNIRKKRSGAFWEDHYHATAVQTGEYLNQCMVYIDLNMVRACVVKHPYQWPFSGYHEIFSGRQRNRLIDKNMLFRLLEAGDIESFKNAHEERIRNAIIRRDLARKSQWTESIAVGSEKFAEEVKGKLGLKVNYRTIKKVNDQHTLREKGRFYKNANFL